MRRWLILVTVASGCSDVHSTVDAGVPGDAGAETRWAPQTVPNVDYFAVSGSSATDVVIVGAQGTILRWNGVKLTAEASGTQVDLHGVVAVSPMVAFAVGGKGTILGWDGATWRDQTLMLAPDAGAVPFLSGVWADSATNAFAVGEGGAAFHYDGTAWKLVATASPDNLLAVDKVGANPQAFGTLGTVATWNGTGFDRAAIPSYPKTVAGVAAGGGGGYLVGVDGALFSYDGAKAFNKISGLPSVFLRGVAAPGDVFVVGWDATVVRVRSGGADLFVYPNVPQRWMQGVWAASDSDVWIVGSSGTVLRGPPLVDPSLDGGAS